MYKVKDIDKDFEIVTKSYQSAILKCGPSKLGIDILESYGVLFSIKAKICNNVEDLDIDFSEYDDYDHYEEDNFDRISFSFGLIDGVKSAFKLIPMMEASIAQEKRM